MRFRILIVMLLTICSTAISQSKSALKYKPPIDSIIFQGWPTVGNADISNDGSYIWYVINDEPLGKYSLEVKSTNTDWAVRFLYADQGVFSQDSKMAGFIMNGDTLCLITLGTSGIEYLPGVCSFKMLKHNKGEWLIYQRKNQNKELLIRELRGGIRMSFNSVDNYTICNEGHYLLLHSRDAEPERETLRFVDLRSEDNILIWRGNNIRKIISDNNQLVFMTESLVNNRLLNSLWYFKRGMQKAILLVDNKIEHINDSMELEDLVAFSKDENRIFIKLKEQDTFGRSVDSVKVNIWKYNDPKLQSQLMNQASPGYLFGLTIDNKKVFRLQEKNELLLSGPNESDRFILLSKIGDDADLGERNWNRAFEKVTLFLVSTLDGNRKTVRIMSQGIQNAYLSPHSKFVVYYDPKQKNYFSYNISSGETMNITKDISTQWTQYEYDEPNASHRTYPIEGWGIGDSMVFLRDRYDIWAISVINNNAFSNLTNGYGRRYNIFFHLYSNTPGRQISVSDRILLIAFNRMNKENGFYEKTGAFTKTDPTILTMGSYIFHIEGPHGFPPKKALHSNAFLVRRESCIESPNYFFTKDFKSYIQISSIYPEKRYNWMFAELVQWQSFNGQKLQGVLYKPENFDPQKKYPVIFDCYERRSDEINFYKKAEPAGDRINIPYFVSNGYLVFTPDIHYTLGNPGYSAYNSVISAAQKLMKYSYVDGKRMGIQGHSFGGYEVNYIISHSNIFSAAMSAAGITDFVSEYGAIAPYNGMSLQFLFELEQNRMGATLWQRPDLYIKNSPIFNVDKIQTPLLMMHNKEDGIVPFSQGLELFTAMRRLNKRVWLLQYDGETHSVFDKKAQKDYTIRMYQFFNHYLKGVRMPQWMK